MGIASTKYTHRYGETTHFPAESGSAAKNPIPKKPWYGSLVSQRTYYTDLRSTTAVNVAGRNTNATNVITLTAALSLSIW
jgi:hypothetical protein